MSDDLVMRLREVAEEKHREAWGRLDGGQDLSIGAMLAEEAAARIEELEKERDALAADGAGVFWAEKAKRCALDHHCTKVDRDFHNDRADAFAALLREAKEALRAWIGAKDALHAFEAENPDNSGKAWQERFDELSAAEEDARALLARLEAREVSHDKGDGQ